MLGRILDLMESNEVESVDIELVAWRQQRQDGDDETYISIIGQRPKPVIGSGAALSTSRRHEPIRATLEGILWNKDDE